MGSETLATYDGEASAHRGDLSIDSLVRQHYVLLYRYAFRLTGSECDAEDLTQQCFLTAHSKLHQLRDPDAAKGWLFQILRTAFFKLCRKRKPVLEIDTEMEMVQVVDDQKDQPFDLERIQQRLCELSDSHRMVLLMFYFEQRSYEEIAAELDIPIGTVMSRLSRAKSHLKARIHPLEATK